MYLNPRPKPEFLSEYYQFEQYDPHRQTGGGVTGSLYRWVRPFSVGYKASLITRRLAPGSLLDVGCGSGEFLLEMKNRGWQVLGIEADHDAAQIVRSRDIPVLVGDPTRVSLPSRRFDVITLWHALEHLPDLQESLIQITSWLQPQGLLVIAVPNPDSWEARFYGSRWVAWDAPRHLYHFRHRDLDSLLTPLGLRWQKYASLPLDPFYHSLLSATTRAQGMLQPLRLFRGLLVGTCSFLRGFKAGRGSSVVYLYQNSK